MEVMQAMQTMKGEGSWPTLHQKCEPRGSDRSANSEF